MRGRRVHRRARRAFNLDRRGDDDAACRVAPVTRSGASAERVVSRVYQTSLPVVRSKILAAFAGRVARPAPFDRMTASELKPPQFQPDWLATTVDPGGFLDAYKQLPAAEREHDVLIQEPTGNLYWPSRLHAGAEGPVRFHCSFILHFVDRQAQGTEMQAYEVVPAVWPGERWGMSAHGVGFGRYHDIGFVEPTDKDRHDVLELVNGLIGR